jgi:hypothetical protein
MDAQNAQSVADEDAMPSLPNRPGMPLLSQVHKGEHKAEGHPHRQLGTRVEMASEQSNDLWQVSPGSEECGADSDYSESDEQ